MIIVAAADLHLSPDTLDQPARLQERASALAADVLIIAGDLTTGGLPQYAKALQALSVFTGPKLFVPGNHDLWQKPEGRDTWRRYEVELPEVVTAAGFHYLDHAPFIHQGYGFVGAMGWYDYSTRQLEPPDADLKLSPATLTSPGSAFRTSPKRRNLKWEELLPEDYRTKALQCQDDNVLQGLVWNDGFYIDWKRPDEEMVQYFCDKLRQQAAQVAPEVDHLVAVTHFVPFPQILPIAKTVTGAYTRAFAGSAALGETIQSLPKIEAALFGHWHSPGLYDINGLLAVNVTINHGKEPPARVELP